MTSHSASCESVKASPFPTLLQQIRYDIAGSAEGWSMAVMLENRSGGTCERKPTDRIDSPHFLLVVSMRLLSEAAINQKVSLSSLLLPRRRVQGECLSAVTGRLFALPCGPLVKRTLRKRGKESVQLLVRSSEHLGKEAKGSVCKGDHFAP